MISGLLAFIVLVLFVYLVFVGTLVICYYLTIPMAHFLTSQVGIKIDNLEFYLMGLLFFSFYLLLKIGLNLKE